MIDFNKMLNDFLDDIIDGKLGEVRKEIEALRALPLVQLSALLEKGTYRTVLEELVEAAVAPLREQIKALEAIGPGGITRPVLNGEVVLVPEIRALVEAVAEEVVDNHTHEYDHDEFVTKDDIGDKINDKLDDVFQGKFEAALDGTCVTLLSTARASR